MIVENKNNYEVVKYNSINEFYDYICNTPFNYAFRWAKHSSVENGEKFTGTKSFEEAVEIMKNGWEDMSKKLTQKLNVVSKDVVFTTKKKSIYDVVGYQANVPRYLQGIPTNMIRTINAPAKQKAITIVKSIGYNCGTTTETIIEESIKAFKTGIIMFQKFLHEKEDQLDEESIDLVKNMIQENEELSKKLNEYSSPHQANFF